MENLNTKVDSKQHENINLNDELTNLSNLFDRYCDIQNDIYTYTRKKIDELSNEIKKLNKEIKYPDSFNYIILDKKQILDIKRGNSNELLFLKEKFPNMKNKPSNFKIVIKEKDINFKVDIVGLLNRISNIYSYFSSIDNFIYHKEEELIEFNNYFNEQLENYNHLEALIKNNIYIYDKEFEINIDLYKNYPEQLNKLRKILDKMSIFSNIFVEMLHLDILIDNNITLQEEKEEIKDLNEEYICDIIDTNNKNLENIDKKYLKKLTITKSKKYMPKNTK